MVTILFLFNNPPDMPYLDINQEYKRIESAINSARNREEFQLIRRDAITMNDLQSALLRYAVDIIHYSGHSSKEGHLMLQDDDGKPVFISGQIFADLLRITSKDSKYRIRCVFLNTAYSEKLAESIIPYTDFVISHGASVTDRAAMEFAASFYESLANGKTFQDSFSLGINQLRLSGIPSRQMPSLLTSKESGRNSGVVEEERYVDDVKTEISDFLSDYIELSPYIATDIWTTKDTLGYFK
jgi:hypothetical protein